MNAALEFDRAAVRLGGREIWSDATFRIERGTLTAVIGPNGAGKTTLIRAILGLLPLSSGSALVAGAPPQRGSGAIGYVPQRRSFDGDISIRGVDVVQFGVDGTRWGINLGRQRRSTQARVDAALAAVDAGSFAARPLSVMSGGQAQRICIAQAIVGDPDLLLLDEPFSGLDIASQTSIAALIARLVRERGLSAVLVAHNLNGLLDYIDRIVFVSGGCIGEGACDEIVTPERLSSIYAAPVEVFRNSAGQRFVVGHTA